MKPRPTMGAGMTNPRGAMNIHAHLEDETKGEEEMSKADRLAKAREKADNSYRDRKGFLVLVGRAVKEGKSVGWIVSEITKTGKHISEDGCRTRIRNLRAKMAKSHDADGNPQSAKLIPKIAGEKASLSRDEELGVLGDYF